MRIGVIGAGHAGIEAAKAARAAGAAVQVFSSEWVVPYYRPRLVALAFGQADFRSIQMQPAEWYRGQGIELKLGARVVSLDIAARAVRTNHGEHRFDAVVLACGAQPVLPPFAAGGVPGVLPLWSVGHADAVRARVKAGRTLVVVGGGILGVEAALRGIDAGMRVQIVELMDRLMPAQFGSRASSTLLRRLRERGIEVTLGQGVAGAEPAGGDAVRLVLTGGREMTSDICLVSIGARPDAALARAAGLAAARGIDVSHQMETSARGWFAAGDAIQYQGVTRCSVREAMLQGRIAGVNAASGDRAESRQSYAPESLPLMFKSGDFELYAIGQPGGDDCDEHLLDGTTETVFRCLIEKDGLPLGVQMIGTRAGFDDYARMVKQKQAGGAKEKS